MAKNDFPRININTEELLAAVEILLANAYANNADMGAVNWGDLGVHDIEYRLSMLTPQDGPHCVVMIEEASPDCRLPAFIYDNLDREKFPGVFFECGW